jgi:hypothetical protein
MLAYSTIEFNIRACMEVCVQQCISDFEKHKRGCLMPMLLFFKLTSNFLPAMVGLAMLGVLTAENSP